MKTRKLGANGPNVSQLGLGCMALSGTYGPADDVESVAVIQEAIDSGITLLDTGDFYGVGHNELLLREALKGRRRETVFIQVKFGALLDPARRFIGFDARPSAVKNSLAHTLTRLGTDYVDLYQPARLDASVPVEDTIAAVAEMVEAGYVRHVGLSEVGPETIRRACAVHSITALQIEYSLMSRSIEEEILPAVRALGIGVTAYGILSRGLLSGRMPDAASPHDIRSSFPRFQGENLERNRTMVAAFAGIAERLGATPAQLATAWVLAQGPDIIPLIGPRTRAQLRDLLAAADLTLGAADIAEMEAVVDAASVAGDRYHPHGMASLDSERR
jgi:pyridoxine 4-dehydrogenase